MRTLGENRENERVGRKAFEENNKRINGLLKRGNHQKKSRKRQRAGREENKDKRVSSNLEDKKNIKLRG